MLSLVHSPIIVTKHDSLIFLRNNLGPTAVSLSIPPAEMVYVTPHSSPLTVTIAILLVIGALPEMPVQTYSYIAM